MDTAVLINITDQSYLLTRTYGTFSVPACVPGQRYALLEVRTRKGTIDLGDKRTIDFPITAREVADDLAREVNSDAGDGSYFGVFVAEGQAPTEAELLIAHDRLTQFYKRLVFSGDQEWERSHHYLLIPDVQRRACRWLGLERDWSYEPQEMKDCPACGTKVRPNVAVCRACGAILDCKKAAEYGMVAPAAAPAPAETQEPVADGEAAVTGGAAAKSGRGKKQT